MKAEIRTSTLEIIQGDITAQDTIAVVNAANKALAPGGGVAGAIHKSAGPLLYEECRKIAPCETGEAKITKAYNLPNEFVIHTVGPVYHGTDLDAFLLAKCYSNSLKLAEEHNIPSIAFPAISTGIFGYPVEEAAQIAIKEIINFLNKGSKILLVRMVLYDNNSFEVHKKTLKNILSL